MDEAELDKSEQATPHKLKRAREKGTVARSLDLGFFGAVATATAFLWVGGTPFALAIAHGSSEAIAAAGGLGADPQVVPVLAAHLIEPVILPLVALAGALFGVGLMLDFAQVGPVFSTTPLKPDLNRINPAKGLKRLLTWRMLIEAAKASVKLAAYAAIAWLVVDRLVLRRAGSLLDARQLAATLAEAALYLLLYFALAALAFAVLDQLYVRRDFAKRMRMSRRELKREHKDREGDPRLKQKRKQFHNEFAKAVRALRNVPRSDLIIVNPTHYAVALRFDPASMEAPVLAARGAGELSRRIRRIGHVYGVTVVSDPPLARALYRHGRLEAEIPSNFYEAVAEIYRRHGPRALLAGRKAASPC